VIFGPKDDIFAVTGKYVYRFSTAGKGEYRESAGLATVEVAPAAEGFAQICTAPADVGRYALVGHDEGGSSTLGNWCAVIGGVMLAARGKTVFAYTRQDGRQELIQREKFPCEQPVREVARNRGGDVAAVQLVDGRVMKLRMDRGEDDESSPSFTWSAWEGLEGDHLRPYSQMAVADAALIGLTSNHRLFVNGGQVMVNATSFSCSADYILVTTLDHRLHWLPVGAMERRVKDKWPGAGSRAVERGSRLVAAVADSSLVILQMPRGNLEGIHPRGLVLAAAGAHIDGGRYEAAMEELRRHRVNLNVLVDHDPESFLTNAQSFVDAVGDSFRICLLLADLREEDCCLTLYGDAYPDRLRAYAWPASGKVSTVTDALRTCLEKEESRFANAIVSCMVRNGQQGVEGALLKIGRWRESHGDVRLAEEALNHLLLLEDVDTLYNAALGLYDLQLCVVVAEKSQKVNAAGSSPFVLLLLSFFRTPRSTWPT